MIKPRIISRWYTFVLTHELCHYLIKKKAKFDVEKYTPEKWTYDSGAHLELELFEKVLDDNDEIIKEISKKGSPFKALVIDKVKDYNQIKMELSLLRFKGFLNFIGDDSSDEDDEDSEYDEEKDIKELSNVLLKK